MNSIDPILHAKRRRLLNLAFTEQSLKRASPIIAKHVDRWTQLLHSGSYMKMHGDVGEYEDIGDGWSQPADMAVAVEYLVFDILGELCFEESFNTKEPDDNILKKVPGQLMNQVTFGYKVSNLPISMIYR